MEILRATKECLSRTVSYLMRLMRAMGPMGRKGLVVLITSIRPWIKLLEQPTTRGDKIAALRTLLAIRAN